MTADSKLLPLPKWMLEAFTDPAIERLCDYTRANVAHATAPLQAEIERLREELDRLRGEHVRVRRDRNAKAARAERLAEALHKLEEACDDSDGAQYGTLATSFVRGICKDALHDHEQEDEK